MQRSGDSSHQEVHRGRVRENKEEPQHSSVMRVILCDVFVGKGSCDLNVGKGDPCDVLETVVICSTNTRCTLEW